MTFQNYRKNNKIILTILIFSFLSYFLKQNTTIKVNKENILFKGDGAVLNAF